MYQTNGWLVLTSVKYVALKYKYVVATFIVHKYMYMLAWRKCLEIFFCDKQEFLEIKGGPQNLVCVPCTPGMHGGNQCVA